MSRPSSPTVPVVSARATHVRAHWTFRSTVSVGLGLSVIVIAIILLARGPVQVAQKYKGNLREILPTAENLPDWRVIDAPIAETPEVQRQVDELLNFDDAVFRVYERGGLRISIYLAYWRPGRMQAKDIGRHTPDVCWVAAGWERTLKDTLNDLRLRNGARVGVAEHRTFLVRGQTEHVVFWHVVNETTHSYRTGGRPPWYWMISDTLRWGLNQKPEQFFLRISSNRSVADWWDTGIVQTVLARMPVVTTPAP